MLLLLEWFAHAGPCKCILKIADFLSQIFLVFRWPNGLRKLLHQIIIVLLLFENYILHIAEIKSSFHILN